MDGCTSRITVEDFQIVCDGRMEMRAENFRRALRLREPQPPRRGRVVPRAAAVAGGEVEVVDFPAALFQQQEGARHHELDVIRVRGDGDGGGHDFLTANAR
jgi:hypothetical protein